MKNGANRRNKRKNDKIQKTDRPELPTEINAVSQRPEKETSQTPRREKSGREMWLGTKPQAQRRFYGTLKVNRNRPLLK